MTQNEVKNKRIKGILGIMFASFLWSTGGLFVKIIDWNPVALAGTRSFIASLILIAYIKKPKLTKSKVKIIGIISSTLTVLCFVAASRLTTSANAILLQYTSPIFVAILSVLVLKEKIRWFDIVSIISVFLGIGLFFMNNLSSGNTVGNLLAVFCGFSLAVSTIVLKMEQDSSPFDITIFGNLLAFIVSVPFIISDLPNMKDLLTVIVMGTFQLGIPYIFYINSLKYVSALEAILLTVIEPLLNPLWVFLFTGETPSIFTIIGGIIVISAVLFRSIYASKISPPEEYMDNEELN
ncbi:MAG TPA: DMT family transporter [Tissierellaceae bacterium]